MRKLVALLCAVCAFVVAGGGAWAGEPTAGTLSVDRGRGVVMIDFRGSALGKLGSGTLRVTDLTPNDRFTALVAGRKFTQERLGLRTVVYRGQGLRFRMLGGGYRMVARGSGITLSAVGRGIFMLDGEPRFPGDDVGVYSSTPGIDCSVESPSCTPLPTEPVRLALEPPPDTPSSRRVP
jgi:hypothetical protein